MAGETENRIWEWVGADTVSVRATTRREPGPGEAELRVQAIGICGTDLHMMSGRFRVAPPPLPLGHELSGIVERVGSGVRHVQPGDRVCVDPLVGCGSCVECAAGRKHRCPQAKEIGLHLPGGWQQFLTVSASQLYRIPDGLSLAEATQAETVHCCVGGVDKLRIEPGMKAAVIGDGPTALLFVQLLRLAGVSQVMLIGMRAERLQAGLALGANEAYAADEAAACADGEWDIAIDAAGTEQSIRRSMRLLRKGGQLLMFGIPGSDVSVDVQMIVMNELHIVGSTNAPDVWPRVIAGMASGTIRVAPLLTHRFPYAELDLALACARSTDSGAIKVIVEIVEETMEDGEPI